MNIKKKCEQIDSLLGDLSSTGIKPIPSLVFEMRMLLSKIEAVEHSVQRIGLWARIKKWFGAIANR